MWVTNYYRDSVIRVDPATRKTREIPVGRGPRGIAFGDGGIWIANSLDDTVTRIDPSSGRVVKCCIAVRFPPYQVAAGDGAI